MKIAEIDKKLDMRLVLRLHQDTELFDVSKHSSKTVPIFTFSRDDKIYISAFFDRKEIDQAGFSALKKLGAETKEDTFVVTSRINNVESMKIINELISRPYIILNRADMSRGNMNFFFRFPGAKLDDVSETVSRYVTNNGNARVVWLGPSQGLKWIIDLINSEYPLSVITYQVPLVERPAFLKNFPEPDDLLFEIGSHVLRGDAFPGILYSRTTNVKSPQDELEDVSSRDGIYGASLRNSFLSEVKKEADEKHIIRTRMFVRLVGERAEATIFLPATQVHDYYSILYGLARKEGRHLTVKYLFDYEQKVWEFL